MDRAARGRAQGEAHIREIQKLFHMCEQAEAGAPTCNRMRGAAGCTARQSNRSRISAGACGSVGGGSITPGNNGTQEGPFEDEGAEWA
jgi:hypothetical protein